jgi:hypothetical protein
MRDHDDDLPLLPWLRSLSAELLALGAAGGALGGLRAHLRGVPVALAVTAFAANSLVVGSAYLAAREAALAAYAGDDAWRGPLASGGAGALVGGAATAAVSGVRRAAAGAALWGCVAAAGAAAAGAARTWRDARGAAAGEREALWAALPPAARARFPDFLHARAAERGAAVRGIEGRLAWPPPTPAGQPPPPPPRALLPALRDFAAAEGVPGAAVTPPPPPPMPPGAAPDAAPARSAWAWLPFRWGADADAYRIDRLRARLAEVEALLGGAPPPPQPTQPDAPRSPLA